MQYPIDNENEVVKTKPVKVTLANTKEETVVPYTIAEQVAFDLANVASPLSNEVPDNVQGALKVALEGALVAKVASEKADAASCKAETASSSAEQAKGKAGAAYDLASTNSGYLSDVKVIFKALAGTMYNDAGEGMGYIYGGNPTVTDIGKTVTDIGKETGQAYELASSAYYIAGSIYNRESKKAADGYNAGTYLLKATIDSDKNITFTWVDEADYKNV